MGLDPSKGENGSTFTGINYLFTIGIDQYDPEHWPPLKCAVKDVQDFTEVLTDRYKFESKDVISLHDKEATTQNILLKFRELKQKVTKDDNLVIYFSGHGHYDDENDTGYWIPVDARRGDKYEYEYIETDRIVNRIRNINSFHTFLIVDACFSGTLITQMRSAPKSEKFKSRRVFTSGRKEVVNDGPEGGNSPFSKGLLTYLGKNDNRYISASELILDVKRYVESNSKQTPMEGRIINTDDEAGEFVLHLKISEDEMWDSTTEKHTIEAYKKFIEQFPKSEHLEEARKLLKMIEAEIWAATVEQHTREACKKFMEQFPQSEHREEAQEAYDWLTAKDKNTKISIEAYLNVYQPKKGKYIKEALDILEGIEEEEDWEKATNKNTLSAYRRYLFRYPDGKYTEKARGIIEELIEKRTWTEAKRKNTIRGYEEYLKGYPDGKYADEANRRIKQMKENEEEGDHDEDGNERAIKPSPADDIEKAWKKAKKAATYKTYREFMGAYPDSRFTNEARQEMKRLDDIALNKIINSGLKRDISVQKKIEQCITYFDNFPDAGNNKDVKKILNQLYKEMGERRGA